MRNGTWSGNQQGWRRAAGGGGQGQGTEVSATNELSSGSSAITQQAHACGLRWGGKREGRRNDETARHNSANNQESGAIRRDERNQQGRWRKGKGSNPENSHPRGGEQ